jgi:alpha-1,2-mannosyltransferase
VETRVVFVLFSSFFSRPLRPRSFFSTALNVQQKKRKALPVPTRELKYLSIYNSIKKMGKDQKKNKVKAEEDNDTNKGKEEKKENATSTLQNATDKQEAKKESTVKVSKKDKEEKESDPKTTKKTEEKIDSPQPKKKPQGDRMLLLFVYLTFIYACGGLINHIDDTDETHGYWEPLHYLLYNSGMQTWEYSPQYAIRSYAFLYPLYLLGKGLAFLHVHKLRVFYFLRVILGVFAASSEVSLVSAVSTRYQNDLLTFYLTAYLVCSSGIFFAGTSFLPSAVASSLLMQCFAAWLSDSYLTAVFWGSIAVLWTGWPFVALLLLPIGVHMLVSVARNEYRKGKGKSNVFGALVMFVLTSLMIVVCVFLPAFMIDARYYGKWYVISLF